MTDGRDTPPMDELPTVRPEDIQWLKTAQPLLLIPKGVGIIEPGPLPLEVAERWLAFYAAAELLEVSWGARHGAVRTTSFLIQDLAILHAISAFGRVVVVAVQPETTIGMGAVARAVAGAAHISGHYSLDWSAAAYVESVAQRDS